MVDNSTSPPYTLLDDHRDLSGKAKKGHVEIVRALLAHLGPGSRVRPKELHRLWKFYEERGYIDGCEAPSVKQVCRILHRLAQEGEHPPVARLADPGPRPPGDRRGGYSVYQVLDGSRRRRG